MRTTKTLFSRRLTTIGVGLLLIAGISLCGMPTALADDPVPTPAPSTPGTARTPTPGAPISTTSATPNPTTASPTPAGTQTSASPAAPDPSQTVSGVLTAVRTAVPIPNSCVGWRSTSAADTDDSFYAAVAEDGTWSIPVNPKSIFFLFFYATKDGNCEGPVDSSSYLPSWYENLPFDFKAPKEARAPMLTLHKVNSGDSGVVACLGTDKLPSGDNACAKADTTLSGRVVGDGPAPIDQACVYVFADTDGKDIVAATITDSDGRWTFADLRSNTTYVVAVIPPFALDGKSCVAENGPVPPPEGALQPEFYANVWFDLGAEQQLKDDAYGWAVKLGAQVLAGSTKGIDVCLTAEAGGVQPRSDCDPPELDTTLSGRVTGYGPVPINQACLFVFDKTGAIGQAISDPDGRWSATGLPNDHPLTVGVLPPFSGKEGPCQFDDGPPPIPVDGELQPEFYANVWINLNSEALRSDPYAWGIKRGAEVIENSTSGINICLTTDLGTAKTRGSCTPAASPPGQLPDPPAAPGDTLADTGGPAAVLLLIGFALLIGAGLVRRAPGRSIRRG